MLRKSYVSNHQVCIRNNHTEWQANGVKRNCRQGCLNYSLLGLSWPCHVSWGFHSNAMLSNVLSAIVMVLLSHYCMSYNTKGIVTYHKPEYFKITNWGQHTNTAWNILLKKCTNFFQWCTTLSPPIYLFILCSFHV